MQALPTKEKAMKEQDSIQAIRVHLAAPGFKLLPGSLQNVMKFVITMISAVDGRSTCKLKLGSMGALAAECWRRMKWFVRYEGSLDGKAAAKMHAGEDAIHALVTRCSQKVKKGVENDIDNEVSLLQKYGFAAHEDDKAQVKILTKADDEEDGGAAGAGGPAPKAKAKAKAKAKSKLETTDESRASALAVFNS